MLLFWVILFAGLCITWTGMRALLKHRTTVRPDKDSMRKSTALVTAGIYQYTRNPVYLGMAIMLFAWMIFLENWASASGIIIFIVFITQFQIRPEEKALEALFGNEYAQYKKRVRRWL